jgi:hypothetical protein
MQTQLRHQQLQTTILILHRLQPLRFTDLHAAELRLPAIERRRADPVLPAQVRSLHLGLMLLQYPDDLLFRVPALLHRQLPRLDYERTPVPTGRDFWGQVRGAPPNRRLARTSLSSVYEVDSCSSDEGAAITHSWDILYVTTIRQ